MGILKYQFSGHGDAEMVSSRDERNFDELKAFHNFQKNEDSKDSAIILAHEEEIMRLSASAPMHEIKVGGESFPCPVIEFCDWWAQFAFLGGKCFPVKGSKGRYSLELRNSMGAKVEEEPLVEIIKRYLHYEKFSYRFL